MNCIQTQTAFSSEKRLEKAQDRAIGILLLQLLLFLLALLIAPMACTFSDVSFLWILLVVIGCTFAVCMLLFIIAAIRICVMRRSLPKSSRPVFFIHLLALLLLGTLLSMGVFLLGAGWAQTAEYNSQADHFVQVQAQITHIEVKTDSDNFETYDAFISYTYNGKLYKNVAYHDYEESMKTGDYIFVEIDPENPGVLPYHGMGATVMGAIITPIGFISLCCASVVPLLKRRKQRGS